MKDRVEDYYKISNKAKRKLRQAGAPPLVRALYCDLCDLEHLLCGRGREWFFFSYTSRPGNPPPGKKGHVYSLIEWTGQGETALRSGLELLDEIGLIELDYHHPINPKTGRLAKKKNMEVRIVD